MNFLPHLIVLRKEEFFSCHCSYFLLTFIGTVLFIKQCNLTSPLYFFSDEYMDLCTSVRLNSASPLPHCLNCFPSWFPLCLFEKKSSCWPPAVMHAWPIVSVWTSVHKHEGEIVSGYVCILCVKKKTNMHSDASPLSRYTPKSPAGFAVKCLRIQQITSLPPSC